MSHAAARAGGTSPTATGGTPFAALLRAAIGSSATKVAGLVATLVSVAITSRVLGPEGRGFVAVVTAFVGLVATFGSFGLGQVTLRRAAERRDTSWLPAAIGVLGSFVGVVTLVTAFGLALAWARGVGEIARVPTAILPFALVLVPLTLWTSFASYLLLAVDRVRDANRAQLAATVVSVTSVAGLVLALRLGVPGALAATAAGLLVSTVLGLRVLLRVAGRRATLTRHTFVEYLRDGSKLHLTAIGAFLFNALDVLMVHHYQGAAAAGIFQLAVQLYTPLLLVPQAASEVVSSKLGALGPTQLWPLQRRLLLLTTGVMVAGALALAVLAPWIVRLLAGTRFDSAVPIFRIALLGVVAATWNSGMAAQWIGRGLLWQASALTIAAGLLNLVGNLYLIPRFGARGAAYATVIGSYAIPFTANMLLAARCQREWRRERIVPPLEVAPT